MDRPFQKWEATGNDFFFVELDPKSCLSSHFTEPALVKSLCGRSNPEGGADGIVLFSRPPGQAVDIRIVNSDGSVSSMCGNALRCLAKLLHLATGEPKHSVNLGCRVVQLASGSGNKATVDMGEVEAISGKALLESPEELSKIVGVPGFLMSFGNPHFVCPVPSIPSDWELLGEACQETAHQLFAQNGVNCGFLESEAGPDGVYQLRVYERGVGKTLSCGSGACAASVVLERVLQKPAPHRLELPGGILEIGRCEGRFLLTGAANFERSGVWSL